MKTAIVLFNLGGPDSLESVEPFLRNLFSDPAIIALPRLLRLPLARLLARRRAVVARHIYAKLGGNSPILPETLAQAQALDKELADRGMDAKSFVAMRCWHPFSDEVACAIKDWGAQRLVLLPLYPQFSATTTGSSFADWQRAARRIGLCPPTTRLCCYPDQQGLIDAFVSRIHTMLTKRKSGVDYRILLSAHGLPKRVIAKGDPYQWQVERTANAIVDRLGTAGVEWVVCYQSRVGPFAWIGPSTDAEIVRAGKDGRGVIVTPIAFVSEHSETLVELDIDYRQLAERSGVLDYLRTPTLGTHPSFISALADQVLTSTKAATTASANGCRICPLQLSRCPCEERHDGVAAR